MFKEFRDFLMRGNVLDLAIAVIIGAAFSSIVNSMVSDMLMPPIGVISGGIDFKDDFVVLSAAKADAAARALGHPIASLSEAKAKGVPVLAYGEFLNNVINFLIVGFSVFMVVRFANHLHRVIPGGRKPPPPPPAPLTRACPFCCNQIPLAATRCGFCTSTVAAAVGTTTAPAPGAPL